MKFMVVALLLAVATASPTGERTKRLYTHDAIMEFRQQAREIPMPLVPFGHQLQRDIIESMSNYLEEYIDQLASHLEEMVAQGENVSHDVLDQISTLIDDLQHLGVENWETGVAHLLEKYSTLLEALFELLAKHQQQSLMKLTKDFILEDFINNILEMINNNESLQFILQYIHQLPAILQELFNQLFGGLTFEEIGELLGGLIEQRRSFSEIWESLQDIITDSDKNLLQPFVQWFQSVWDLFTMHISAQVQQLQHIAKEYGQEVGKKRVDVAYMVFHHLQPFFDHLSTPWRNVVITARSIMLRE